MAQPSTNQIQHEVELTEMDVISQDAVLNLKVRHWFTISAGILMLERANNAQNSDRRLCTNRVCSSRCFHFLCRSKSLRHFLSCTDSSVMESRLRWVMCDVFHFMMSLSHTSRLSKFGNMRCVRCDLELGTFSWRTSVLLLLRIGWHSRSRSHTDRMNVPTRMNDPVGPVPLRIPSSSAWAAELSPTKCCVSWNG